VTVNGSRTITGYLNDPDNPTGYTQVLEEHTTGTSTPTVSYLPGLAVFGQTNQIGATTYLMPDGQGSTRLLTDGSGTITTRFGYDAYGSALGITLGAISPPATRILYGGQQFDLTLQQYYLRARYVNPVSGRFGSVDPAQGQPASPVSFESYVYAGNNPITNSDPTGRDLVQTIIVVAIIATAFVMLVSGLARLFGISSVQSAVITAAQQEARTRLTRAHELVSDDRLWDETRAYYRTSSGWMRVLLANRDHYRRLLETTLNGLDSNPPQFTRANFNLTLQADGGPAYVVSKGGKIHLRDMFFQEPFPAAWHDRSYVLTHEYGRVYLWDDLPQSADFSGTPQDIDNWDNIVRILARDYDDIKSGKPRLR